VTLADVQIAEREHAFVATLSGEVDLSNAERIGEAILSAVPNQALSLILDLTAVDYLDSSGIQLIYQLRERLKARGQSLHLVIPDASPTHDALRLAGILRHIESLASVDEALRATTADPV
jgi:anti-anti-sigma factor